MTVIKNFRLFSICMVVIFLLFSFAWLLAPEILLQFLQIEYHPSAALMSRRIAALLAGFSVILIGMRDTPASIPRSAFALGLATALILTGALGFYEFLNDRAGMLLALMASGEIMLGAWALIFVRR